jgi:hypothetical protein
MATLLILLAIVIPVVSCAIIASAPSHRGWR